MIYFQDIYVFSDNGHMPGLVYVLKLIVWLQITCKINKNRSFCLNLLAGVEIYLSDIFFFSVHLKVVIINNIFIFNRVITKFYA